MRAATRVRNPIPGNIIPLARLNPIAQAFNKYFPAPNLAGRPVYARQQLVCPGKHAERRQQDRRQDRPQHFGQAAPQLPLRRGLGLERRRQPHRQHLAQRKPRHSTASRISSSTIRARRAPRRSSPRARAFCAPSRFATRSASASTPTNWASARVHVRRPACRPSRSFQHQNIARWAPADSRSSTASKTCTSTRARSPRFMGGHTIKAGAEYRKISRELFPAEYAERQLHLQPQPDRRRIRWSPVRRQGDGLASALLGFGSGGVMSIDYPTAQTAGYFGTYINDDWRISRKLTLNLGLRYDFDIPRTDRYNRINWLDLSAPSPLADNPQLKALFPGRLNGLMRFADANNRTPYNGDYNNCAAARRLRLRPEQQDLDPRRLWHLLRGVPAHRKGRGGDGIRHSPTRAFRGRLDSGRTQYATSANPFPVGLTFPPGRDAVCVPGASARARPCRRTTTRSTSNGTSPSSGKCRATAWWRRTTSAPRARTCIFGQGDVVSELESAGPIVLGHGQEHAHVAGAEPVLRDHHESRGHRRITSRRSS